VIGKWVDISIIIFAIMGLYRGFRRGLVRELFSLVGAILAVTVAYQMYQELAFYLIEAYPLEEWQAQAIGFIALVLGISLIAAFFGYFWSRVIRFTPFAFLDHLAGAGFGIAKVLLVTMVIVAVLASLGVAPVDALLQDSNVAQQVIIVLPLVHQRLDSWWPHNWPRPGWLFPSSMTAFIGMQIDPAT